MLNLLVLRVGMFFSKHPQNRHPERSASQMDRVTQRLWRGVEEPVPSAAEGTSAVLIFPMLFGAFRPPKPDSRICCDTHLMVTGTSFHEDRGGAARSGLRWLKSSEQHG